MKTQTDENALLKARLEDLARTAEEKGYTAVSDFLTPPQQQIARRVAETHREIVFRLEGGYEQAERKRAVFSPEWDAEPDPQISVLALTTRGEYPTHPEILGALIGCGIRREKVGDILIAEPPKILCDTALVPYLTENFTKAGSKSFHALPSDLGDIPLPDAQTRTFTVASLRLDSVTAEAFRISRTAAADRIKKGEVCLNWEEILSPADEIREGDTVSLRGTGRAVLREIGGTSRKDRIFLTVDVFLRRK